MPIRVIPTEKDNIIDDMDEKYGLDLDDEKYERLRRLSASDLLLVTLLLERSRKHTIRKQAEEEHG